MNTSGIEVAALPYASWLKIRAELVDQEVQFCLPADDRFMGNPMIRAFHGGVINGFLNCVIRLNTMQVAGLDVPPKLVSMTTGYLRSALISDNLYASATVIRLGRRIISVSAKAWQSSESASVRQVAQATASLQIQAGA